MILYEGINRRTVLQVPTIVVPVQSVSIVGEADQLSSVLGSELKPLPYVEDRLLIARQAT